MAAQSRPTARRTDPLDVPRRPLSIRTLYRRAGTASLAEAMERVRGEFVEMRGFSPTLEQAARLFDLLPDECARVLTTLTTEGFICRAADGRYRLTARD